MAMGKRPAARQAFPMWVDTSDLPTSDGHPYFERLNRVLADSGFDAFVEELCAAFYADRLGRPSLRPGRYFRMLFIGYFEGLSSERGIAWRVADSLSLRSFLDLELTEAAPDHSTLSRTRRRIDVETHEAVFTWVLERLSAAGLVRGKKAAAQEALYGNRRRVRGRRGRRLQRRRGEVVERTFAHMYETGGLRRVWVRGHDNVRKRVLLQAAACNIGLLLRSQNGVGTPRSLQGRAVSAICRLIGRMIDRWGRLRCLWRFKWTPTALVGSIAHRQAA